MREETVGPIVSAGPIGCDAGSNQVLHQITSGQGMHSVLPTTSTQGFLARLAAYAPVDPWH